MINSRPISLRLLILLGLTLLALILTAFALAGISRTDPWYRNLDMNIYNMDQALVLNAGMSPHHVDQPGLTMKYLLALDYRIRHSLGALSVWNIERFGAEADPLRRIPELIRIGRTHSRILILLFILSAGALVYGITREIGPACLTVILFCGSSGVLFHGLLSRPELLCVWCGNVLALLCTVHATGLGYRPRRHLWLFLAGFFVGMSVLSKLPGVVYLAACYVWCWLAALDRNNAGEEPATPDITLRAVYAWLLPLLGGASVFWLLFRLAKYPTVLEPSESLRLRVAAIGIGLLVLLALLPGPGRLWRFLRERCGELALLGGGALAALASSHLLLRGILAEPNAADHTGRVLHLVINPTPFLKIVADNPDIAHEFMRFYQNNSFLFISTPLFALGIFLVRPIPRRLKAMIGLLLACAYGLSLLMSRRYYLAQYNIFPQVPLLLVWAVGLHGLCRWLQDAWSAKYAGWIPSSAAAVALALVLTVGPHMRKLYETFQDDAQVPLRDLSVLSLYDHDIHTQPYLHIMAERYGDKAAFRRIVDEFLSDPARRY